MTEQTFLVITNTISGILGVIVGYAALRYTKHKDELKNSEEKERRLTRIEDCCKQVKESVDKMAPEVSSLSKDVAFIKGVVSTKELTEGE